MVAVRRLYLYVLSAISLSMVVGGAAALGGSVIELALGVAIFSSFRQAVSTSIAVVFVGAPVWVIHWVSAQRIARRDDADRRSALRRLYLYLVLAGLLISAVVFATRLLENLLSVLVGGGSPDAAGAGTAAWQLLVAVLFWWYHARIVTADRAAVGEEGASATLRRWYVYGVQFAALLNVLFGARGLSTTTVANVGALLPAFQLAHTAALTLVWLAIFVSHVRWSAISPTALPERASTLRAVEGFLVIAFAVVLVLTDASRALYYLLARALGVEKPGGIESLDFAVLTGPLSTVLVFGGAWAATRYRLRQDTAQQETPRQAGIRRLYEHLVALVAVIALAAGLASLLNTTLDALIPPTNPGWRDGLSLALTLIVVALPTWILHWRASPEPSERGTLSRRLYLFASLALSVLALLISGAALIKIVLDAALGASVDSLARSVVPPISVVTVAAVLGAYHWRVLRRDGAERVGSGVEEAEPAGGERFHVEVEGASEAELRAALASLPARANYSVRQEPAE